MTANLVCALADLGRRVLLVDADPQCNLTSFFIEDAVVDNLLDQSDTAGGQTVWTAMKPLVEATGDAQIVAPVTLRTNISLLPGDIRLAEFEEELPALWAECFQRKPRGFRGTTGLSALVSDVAAEEDADYVIYDCGPNIGALNRVVLLDADYFIVPAACDLFSARAIKTLGHTLVSWINDWSTIGDLAPSELYLLPGRPKLMGYVPQRFRTYGGAPTIAQANYISRLDRTVQDDVVSLLQAIDPDLASYRPTKMGEIKDFGSLASRSQTKGRAIWELDDASPQQRQDALSAFRGLAREVERRAGRPSP